MRVIKILEFDIPGNEPCLRISEDQALELYSELDAYFNPALEVADEEVTESVDN
jgi:hypothetical protein